MARVLVTGGAGYKGTLLVGSLLAAGHEVCLLDNFMYGYEPAFGFADNERCHINAKDVRNLEASDVEGFEVVYNLAAISGYPACEANPHSAQTINVDSTNRLVDLLSDDQILVYASTTSFYGRAGTLQDETSTPTPVSLYGLTKYEAERTCMNREHSIAFRFATLFGASLKMRCDLMPNDFTYKAVVERSLVLFDSHSVRTFLHVRDAVQAYMMVMDRPDELMGGVFNVGATEMNASKLQLAEAIKKHVDMEIIQSTLDDPDRRDFIIDFSKISALGFKPVHSIDDGILELVNLYRWYRPYSMYQTI